MPPKKKTPKQYAKTPKVPSPPVRRVANVPFPEDIYTRIPSDKYAEIPVNTQIGYSYRHANGKIINIKSAFVQQHLVSAAGESMLSVKCGTKIWVNLYKNLAIYYFNCDREKIKRAKATHPPQQLIGIGERVKKLENTVNIILRRSL